MTRWPVVLLVLTTLGVAGACERDHPAAPTPPQAQDPVPAPATMTGLVVSVPETLALRANARYSDGLLPPVQPQWSVTPVGAAEVSPSGVLTTRVPGDVRITARLAEFEAQITVRVAPNYAGTWRGPWRRMECFGPRCGQGDFANPTIDLLVTQAAIGPGLTAVMLFGPWDGTR
ncbi:MAG: hypothetical protein AB7P34_04420 [Vicinamibacterales bacterium]